MMCLVMIFSCPLVDRRGARPIEPRLSRNVLSIKRQPDPYPFRATIETGDQPRGEEGERQREQRRIVVGEWRRPQLEGRSPDAWAQGDENQGANQSGERARDGS